MLLTMVRKGEFTNARWDEIDFEECLWIIPRERMKRRREHVIYLSDQAMDIITGLKVCAMGSEYLIPGRYDIRKPLSNAALNNVIDGVVKRINENGIEFAPVTVHDLRRTASTLLHEAGFNSDWIEKCLAHEQKGVRAVYNKAEYAEQRRDMLQQ
ncbi:site-specific recombinase, phage integrase family [Providencia alcalifaciens PAL-3]|nr:site-specific recombinase, phage integrase family [Providencia alcalifaciens PAL-3]